MTEPDWATKQQQHKLSLKKKYIVKINLLKKLQMSLIVNGKIFEKEDRHIIYIVEICVLL